MDLKDIEAWGRELLEHEAAKRGVRSPEVYSRTDLVRLILKHDYGAPRNIKEAARLIGGIFGSAREVLKKRLGPLQPPVVKTYVGAAREAADWGRGGGARGADVPVTSANHVSADAAAAALAREEADALRAAEQVRAEARDVRRESDRVRSDTRTAVQHEANQPRPEAGWHRVRLGRDLPPPASKAGEARGDVPAADDVPVSHLRLVEPLSPLPSSGEAQAASTKPAEDSLRAPESTEQLSYGPHPQDGLLLRWRVTSEAIDRARELLGSKGELAVRIVAVRVEPHAVVKTDVIDHGPIAETGDWIAPFLPAEAQYVSSIGVKSATKFVSIVHAKS